MGFVCMFLHTKIKTIKQCRIQSQTVGLKPLNLLAATGHHNIACAYMEVSQHCDVSYKLELLELAINHGKEAITCYNKVDIGKGVRFGPAQDAHNQDDAKALIETFKVWS